jgi:hypothetical protein
MKQELIIASFFTILSFNISAQDNISGQEGNMIQTEIKDPVMENNLTVMAVNMQSMSVRARETPSGPGKGAIVSNQANQLVNTKRHNMNSGNIALSNYESKNRNRMQMHASSVRKNQALIVHNAMRGAQRNAFHGRK